MRAEAVCADAAKGSIRRCLLFTARCQSRSDLGGSLWNSPAFYEKRWDNKSANVNVRGEIAKKVRGIVDDTTRIFSSRRMQSSPALIDRYI